MQLTGFSLSAESSYALCVLSSWVCLLFGIADLQHMSLTPAVKQAGLPV